MATSVSFEEVGVEEDSPDDSSDGDCELDMDVSNDSVDMALVKYEVDTIDELKYGPVAEALMRMVDNVVSSGCNDSDKGLLDVD